MTEDRFASPVYLSHPTFHTNIQLGNCPALTELSYHCLPPALAAPAANDDLLILIKKNAGQESKQQT